MFKGLLIDKNKKYNIFIASRSEDVNVFYKNKNEYRNTKIVPLSLESYITIQDLKLNKNIFDGDYPKGTNSKDFLLYSKKINDLVLSRKDFFLNINISFFSIINLACYIKNIMNFSKWLDNSKRVLFLIIPFDQNYSVSWGGVNTPWILPIIFSVIQKHKSKFISINNSMPIHRYYIVSIFLLKLLKFIFYKLKMGRLKLSCPVLPNGNFNLLYDGWGGDLEKTFSLKDELKKNKIKQNRSIHIFYNWEKNKNIFQYDNNSKYRNIIDNEELDKVESSFRPRLFKNIFITFNQLKLLNAELGLNSSGLVKLILFPFNYISLIESDKFQILAENYFSKIKVDTYISIDGGNRLSRAKMLYAISNGIKTISVPHGYDLFTEPIGYYLGENIYIGYGKGKDLIEKSEYLEERIKVKVNRKEGKIKKRGKNKIIFLFSDTHIRQFDFRPEEFLFFIELIKNISIKTDKVIELKFHPNLVNDPSYEIINNYLNNIFKKQNNIFVNYRLKAYDDYYDCALMFSTNIVSSALVFAAFQDVPVFYLKTKWSNTNNYFSLSKTLGRENSILIKSIEQGSKILLSLIDQQNKFQKKTLNNFIEYQFSNSELDQKF